MPEDILAAANRAASGIVSPVHVPPAHGVHSIRLWAKPANDTFASLARVRDWRHTASGRRLPPLMDVDLFRKAQAPVIDPKLARIPIMPRPRGGDPAPIPLDHQMTAAILGQFVVENAAGRTGMAKAVVAFVKKAGARHGMDALLLTAVLHLEAAHDPALADALTVWRSTAGGAGAVEGGDSGVVFDPQRAGLVSVGTPVFRDPFAGGVALPAVVQHMHQLQGEDVGIGSFVVVIVLGLVGAVRGAADAVSKGGGVGDAAWGAISGFFAAIAGLVNQLGGGIIGLATQDTGKPTSADTNSAAINLHTDGSGTVLVFNIGQGSGNSGSTSTDNTGKDPGGMLNPTGGGGSGDTGTDPGGFKDLNKGGSGGSQDKVDTNTSTSSGGGNSGGTGSGSGDPSNEDHQVPPPSNVGFPGPEDDGGSPWSLVGSAPLAPMSAARAMVSANAGPVFAVAQLPGLTAVQGMLNARAPVMNQLANLRTVLQADPGKLASFKGLAGTISTQIMANAHLAPALGAQIGRVAQQAGH